MGKIVAHPKAGSPLAVFPGIAAFDRRGAELAFEMLCSLEDTGTTDDDGIIAADRACLENWPREANSFRNIVAEYLVQAKRFGPEAEAGFCAVLSDFVSICCSGSVPDAERYEKMLGLQAEVSNDHA